MNIAPDTPFHYDSRTRRLHWLTAGLVIILWCLGQTIDWLPHGAPRVFVRSTHICIGALLAALLTYRLWWRATGGLHLPALGSGILRRLGKSMHLALYACLLAAVVLGLANVWVRGDTVFYLFKVPAFDKGNQALRASAEDFHALAANLLLILSGVHAAAGLAHHFLMKDGRFARMLPKRGTP